MITTVDLAGFTESVGVDADPTRVRALVEALDDATNGHSWGEIVTALLWSYSCVAHASGKSSVALTILRMMQIHAEDEIRSIQTLERMASESGQS